MIFTKPAAMRDGFGHALVDLGKTNPKVVALSADLAEPTRVNWFAEQFPHRFYQMGISENDMIGTAAGMATNGLIPFATTFAIFATSLAHQPIRVSVAYGQANVKIVASHGGITVGGDGATHQALEDLALMRLLPGMTVLCPGDANEAYQATLAVAELVGPVYMRVGRIDSPILSEGSEPFEIGKVRTRTDGSDVVVFATGLMVARAVDAARRLAGEGIAARVIEVHTLKPLDVEAILQAVSECRTAVTVEEHTVLGGLGGAIAELLSQRLPAPLECLGIQDTFGEAGEPEEVLEKHHLTADSVVSAARRAIDRKPTRVRSVR